MTAATVLKRVVISSSPKFRVFSAVRAASKSFESLTEGTRTQPDLLKKEVLRSGELVLRLDVRGERLAELVEDMEGALIATLLDDAILLEQVRDNGATRDVSVVTEGNLDELTETRRVVVLGGLGITKGLKQRVALKELLLELTLRTRATSNGSKVLNDLLGVLGLTGTRLTSYEHRLRLAVSEKVAV